MSTRLPTISTSAAVVGQPVGSYDFSKIALNVTPTQAQIVQGVLAHLYLLNESGVGLLINFAGVAETEIIPAGQWRIYTLDPNCTGVQFIADYIIPNAPVSNLYGVYYQPSEMPPQAGVLGNSPIGVSGTIATVGSNTLTNDGNPVGTLVIEMTPASQGSSSWQENNDGSGFQQTMSSSNLRTVWNVTRGGASPAVIQFGDSTTPAITSFYGAVKGGQPANVGSITGAGANSFDGGSFTTDGSGNINLNNVNCGNINDTKITNSTTFSSDGAKLTTDGSGNVTAISYKTDSATTSSNYIAVTANGQTGDQTQLDWIDNNSGGVRWNIGKLSHTHGGSPSVSDAVDFFDVTNNVSSLIILPNNGGLLDQNRNHFATLASVGGGAAGRTVWDGTSDPTTNAGEGDIWAAA